MKLGTRALLLLALTPAMIMTAFAQPPVPRKPAPVKARAAAKPRARVIQPRAAVNPSPANQGINWRSVDLHWNMLLQSASSYSSAVGFAYTPSYQIRSGFSAGLSAGAQMAKSTDAKMMAIAELGIFLEVPLTTEIFFRPDGGMAASFPAAPPGSTSKTAFPYFGGGFGYHMSKTSLVQSLSIQYQILSADSKTHQILFGLGIGW